MNFKSIVFTALVFTSIANYQMLAIAPITNDYQFNDIMAKGGIDIIALASSPSDLDNLSAELSAIEIRGEFPSAHFYYSTPYTIPNSVQKYRLATVGVTVFKNGTVIGKIEGSPDIQDLIRRLKQILG